MIQPPQAVAKKCPENHEAASKSKIPVVALNVEVVTDTVAARLATTLLGHVLYLKNQIPLPIVQISRMTNRKGNIKAAKVKADLLSSFDTLASHLVTTFSALSTALAKAKSSSSSDDDGSVSRAYMAILVGPSLGTARSKVIYGVDNFALHIWGTRDDEEDEVDGGGGGEEYPEDSEDDEEDDSTESGSAEETESEEEDIPEGGNRENSESRQDKEEVTDEDVNEPAWQENDCRKPSPSPRQSFAEEQRFLHSADRLLAQVLASADAEGHGISNEMSPSQIHILLRAPRRFTHPVWVPRQNIQKQMEAALADFINESWPSQERDNSATKKKKPVEGVWVAAKSGLRDPPVSLKEETNVSEENEMIWWSWDGRLVGFSDW